MPSSMCCPVGFSRQCRIVSASSANQSVRSLADHTPTLFTHPPRLVLELTSGLTVTTRPAASGACAGQVEQGPAQRRLGGGYSGRRPAEVLRYTGAEPAAGRPGRFSRCGGLRAQPRRRAVRREAVPGLVGVGAQVRGELLICSTVSSAEWFCGCPSMGRP